MKKNLKIQSTAYPDGTKAIYLKVPAEIHTELKMKSVKTGKSMTEIIINLLKGALK